MALIQRLYIDNYTWIAQKGTVPISTGFLKIICKICTESTTIYIYIYTVELLKSGLVGNSTIPDFRSFRFLGVYLKNTNQNLQNATD